MMKRNFSEIFETASTANEVSELLQSVKNALVEYLNSGFTYYLLKEDIGKDK